MHKLGILSESSTALTTLFQLEGYNTFIIKDKNHSLDLDGIVLNLDNENRLAQTIDWLLYLKDYPKVFVWVLTPNLSKKEEETKIFLELGANDVLSEDNELEKLMYTIKNTFRRIRKIEKGQKISVNQLLNEKNRSIDINGDDIQLTPLEYKMVSLLVSEINSTHTYESIFQMIWGDGAIELSEQKFRVSNVIFHLRNKVKDSRQIEIVTTHGIGYKVAELENF
ncbi:winged helix-turn-helix domain-containing protein [Enterococcus sp. LJL99]